MNLARRRAGKLAQARGAYVENLAAAEIMRRGAVRAEILATPIRMVRGKPMRTKKVLADIVGWWPSGKVILCECKCREEDGKFRRPRRSDFEDHQIDNLQACADAGGTALVAYLLTGQHGAELVVEEQFLTTSDTALPRGSFLGRRA